MSARFPGQVIPDPDEVHKINRARLAILLRMAPHEIDAMPDEDVEELMAVKMIDDRLEAASQQARK